MEVAARFRGLLTDVSARLSGVAPEGVDAAIEHALAALLDFFGTDRCSLLEMRPEDGVVVSSHSLARPGFEAVVTGTRVAPLLPWYHDRLRHGETLRFERLPDDLPADAAEERSYITALPMRSHLAVPLLVSGRWVCALVTATATTYRSWSDEDVECMRILGQMLANAVYRRNIEGELRESLAEVQQLQRRLEAENQYLRETVGADADFEEISGDSPAIRATIELAAQVAPTSTTVLLLGETGTGKELLARAIHARSRRADRALIKVNCAALPASLIESELFGHEKGAFTGATSARPGRFELADGGTLFLDEVGEIPLEMQVKLLRVLQEGEFERVGATRTRRVNVRLVAATNRDLEAAMAEGLFRADLYYRLSAFPIQVPPLRERRGDIPLLVWDLIQSRQTELGRRIERVPESAMRALSQYAWPGNIRELGNVIERALILSPGPDLQLDAVFARLATKAVPAERMDDVERGHVLRILERCEWRINGAGNAAAMLGMRPSTLRSRLKKLGLSRPPVAPPALPTLTT